MKKGFFLLLMSIALQFGCYAFSQNQEDFEQQNDTEIVKQDLSFDTQAVTLEVDSFSVSPISSEILKELNVITSQKDFFRNYKNRDKVHLMLLYKGDIKQSVIIKNSKFLERISPHWYIDTIKMNKLRKDYLKRENKKTKDTKKYYLNLNRV